VAPRSIRLDGPLAHHGILATATFSDGSRRDVTLEIRLSSSAPRVTAIEAGSVAARGDGQAVVAARYGKLAARAPVEVVGVHRPLWYSFRNDVVPMLARVGCSAGACHGANSGKGGLKLSLRGYAPELDYAAITRQLGGRRICREAPERSLLLWKPTLQVRHGGGHVLQIGSREYNTLLGWLREGAPGVDERDPKLTGLTALPGDRTYCPNEHQRVLIRASFSDGHAEDVTERAIFRSNDVAVAKVSDDGEVRALNPGATAVMAKYMDRLAVLRVTGPYSQPANAAAFKERNNYVDDAVSAGLRELNLEPSGLCTDPEFLRQDDYYHFAAIFAQVSGEGPGDVVPANLVAKDAGEVRQPRTGQVMVAEPLDRTDLNLQGEEDRRVKFARWLTGSGSDLFSKNIVNRIWARLFGAGIVEPVDDLRSTNPPRHERLLNALARDLIAHHYDLKCLMATIMRSRTYQASSTPTRANKIDNQFSPTTRCAVFPRRR
jgi:hypothetical protein